MSIFDKLSTFKNRYKDLLQETQAETEWKVATSDASIMPDILDASAEVLAVVGDAYKSEYRWGYNGYGLYSGGVFIHGA